MAYLASDYMADLHEVVVNDISKVVSREPVVFHDNLVVDCAVIENNLPVDDVLKLRLASGYLHPHNETFSACLALFHLFFWQLHTSPVVLRLRVLLTTDFNSHFLQALGCAEATISVSSLDVVTKLFDVLPQADGCSTFSTDPVSDSGCKGRVHPSWSDVSSGKGSQGPHPKSCRTT